MASPGPDPTGPYPGQSLPSFARGTGFDLWNRFAAVNDEFVPIHMDDEAGREAGFPGAFGMGNLQWSFLHSALRQWLGDDGRILRVSCRFRAPNLKGRTVSAGGRITAVRREGTEVLADLEVWTVDDQGQVLAPGTATVALPAGAENSGP
ncbi:MAG TPA: MaoC/PaaZ C-terminal domain-containing protein [Acidimicrobiales bacterium]|nr:MaoC/PaaZ C-terminal domain-containing protein [Acidimicrobiales bacterium]